jgi:RES domain-containing protein
MIVFRMHRTSVGPFDTAGAFLAPGRWHMAGTRVIYAAQHASLAALETLVHSGGRKIPPRTISRISIPGDLLPETADWMELPDSQRFGDIWVRERRGAVLRVPSVVVNRMESNFVLNPAHPDFARIRADSSHEFEFDSRFFRGFQM